MSNVSTSLNRYYVKNGYHVVCSDEHYFQDLIDVFQSKSKAVSYARQLFYKKIIEMFSESRIPDGYFVEENMISNSKPYSFCHSFALCSSSDQCFVLQVSVHYVNTKQHDS